MKKGICHGSIPGSTLAQRFALAKEAGYDGVEISTMLDPAEAGRCRKDADAAGIAVHSVMDSLHWQCPLSSKDEETRTKGVENVRASIRTAQIVGADAVLVVPGVVNEATTYEDAMVNSTRSLEELLPEAEESGIKLCIENVWNKFLLSPLEMKHFIESIGSDNVQAYFDVGNIVLYGYPDHWIRTLGSLISKVHVKGFNANKRDFCWLLEGTIDWQAVMTALRDVGYNGYVTAELPTYPTCPEQMVRDTSAHLDRIFDM